MGCWLLSSDFEDVVDVAGFVFDCVGVGGVEEPVAVDDEFVLVDAGVEVYAADPFAALASEDELRLVPKVEGAREDDDRGVFVTFEPERGGALEARRRELYAARGVGLALVCEG